MFCSKIYIYMFESKRDYNRRNRKERRKRMHNRVYLESTSKSSLQYQEDKKMKKAEILHAFE